MWTLHGRMGLLAFPAVPRDATVRSAREAPACADTQVEAIFRRHYPFVRRVLKYWGVPPDGLDDAAQDVFVVVTRRVETLETSTDVRSWLLGIARKVAGNHRRTRQRTLARRSRLGALRQPPLGSVPDASDDVALAVRLLLELPDPQRVVFVLADLEGWTAPEIAESLGVNLSTVYSRLRTARRRLEQMHQDLVAREDRR
jgi:RNA polymerase sigma-70 factor (ECF subfamily)